MFTYGSRIAIFAAISALILAGVFTIANPLRDQQRSKDFQLSLQELIPSATSFQHVSANSSVFYKALGPNKTLKGYIIPVSAKGYSSTIEMIVAIDSKKVIQGFKILSQQETPGLGTRICEIRSGDKKPWFQVQFIGKKPGELMLKKEKGTIDAITGATISSKAVTNALHKALLDLKLENTKH